MSQLLWARTKVPGENPRISAERWLYSFHIRTGLESTLLGIELANLEVKGECSELNATEAHYYCTISLLITNNLLNNSKPNSGQSLFFQFTEVIFVDEKSKEKAAFKKSGLAVKFSGNYNKKADAYDLWTAKGVPSTKFKYQMLVCDTSFYKGLHFSGYTNCYKKCDNWCGDTSSPYFRTSAAKKQGYSGVAFNENGHKEVKNRLISAGIR